MQLMNYITNLQERKALLTRIIPKVPQTGGRWGKKLNWTEYFKANPFDAPLLGYDVRDKKPELWNRNNVMARDMLERKAVAPPQSNGFGFADTDSPPKLKGTPSGLLTDPNERKQLLMEIFPQLPEGPTGSKSWKKWFEDHPEQATALGYDIRDRRPKIWAANLRISQQRLFRREVLTPQTGPLVPYKVSTPDSIAEGIKELENKADIIQEMQRKAEVKELRDKIRELEVLNSNCRAELAGAQEIIFELMMQIRDLKK